MIKFLKKFCLFRLSCFVIDIFVLGGNILIYCIRHAFRTLVWRIICLTFSLLQPVSNDHTMLWSPSTLFNCGHKHECLSSWHNFWPEIFSRCIPFKYKSLGENDNDEPEKVVEVLMINSNSGPGLLFPKVRVMDLKVVNCNLISFLTICFIFQLLMFYLFPRWLFAIFIIKIMWPSVIHSFLHGFFFFSSFPAIYIG